MSNSRAVRRIAAIGAVYGLTTAPFNLSPLLVGAVITVLGASHQQAGQLMTLELLSMSVVAIVATPLVDRVRQPLFLLVCTSVLIVIHAASGFVQEYHQLLVLRLLAGISAGFLLLAVNAAIAASSDPVRLYGLAAVASTLVSLMLLSSMPASISAAGLVGAYGPLAAVALITIALVNGLAAPPGAVRAAHLTAPSALRVMLRSSNIRLLLLALFAIQATQAALYAFSEQMGVERVGLATDEMGMLLVVGYLSALPASALASWLSYRWGRRLPLLTGFSCYGIATVTMVLASGSELFAAAFIVFNFSYFFLLPYQLGIPADLDRSGRLSGVGVGTIFIGLSCGPFLGGVLVSQGGYNLLCLIAAATACLGACLLAHVVGRASESRRGPVGAAL